MSRNKLLVWLTLSLALGLLLAVNAAQAQGGLISGTVTSPGGYPLPDGTVVKLFEPGDWDVFAWANVDKSDGSFSLGPVPNGLYAIRAVPPAGSGYTQSETQMVSVLNNGVDVGDLALTTPQIIGTVVAPDGATPTDAWVKVHAGDGTLLQSVNAPGGHFVVGGLTSGGYGLVASPVGQVPYWNSVPEPVNISGGTASIPVTLTLRAADLYGTVEDELGNPVPHATVYAVKPLDPQQGATDLSDAQGYFALGGLPNGLYLLGAKPPWDQGGLVPPRPISLTLPTANNPYTLTFSSAPKIISGTVKTNTRVPVEAAQIIAHRVDKSGRAATLSDAYGGYRLNLTPGLWALTVKPISITRPSRWVYNKPPQLVHFEHNTQPEGKVQHFVVLTADAHVTGTVQPPGGTATLPFTVTVALHDDEGVGIRQAVEPDGSFDVPLPHGGYQVWVTPHHPDYMGPVVAPIHVPPSSTVGLGTLYLLERNSAITGTVTDEGGAGVPGIPVAAWRPGAPGGARARTGLDGQYVLPVVTGDWHVQPSPGPQQPYLYTGPGARVSVGVSETVGDIDFELVAADATIVGVLRTESGLPASDADGWASATDLISPTLHNGAPVDAGTFAIPVPGGHTYAVAAHLPAGGPYMSSGEKNVAVGASETVTVTLTVLEKDATIRGALWDPRHEDVVEGVDGMVGAWSGGNWAGTHINSGNGTFRFDVADGLWHLGYRIDPDAGYVKLLHHKNVPVASGQTVDVPLPVAPKDGLITGTVLGPGGAPIAGATVIANGVGPAPEIEHVWLKTHSRPDGSFRLAVPYGAYHLGATVGVTTSIKPALKRVVVPHLPAVSGGHVLQFRAPDATLSGTLTISSSHAITGPVQVWGWSDDDGFVKGRFPVTHSTGPYSLDVVSNTTWHLGAVYETPAYYWIGRADVTLGAGGATQDITLIGPRPKPGPVAVTFDASQPQRIVLEDGTHIFIPAGAMPVAGRVTLHILPIATLPHQRHANVYRYGYAFNALDDAGEPITDHFNQDVLIGFRYDEAELRRWGILEHLLKPAYFSTTTNRWTFPESYAVDYEHDVVMMQIDHFTDFALTTAGDAGDVYRLYLPLVTNNRSQH